ncbi:MAG: response regulator transcription factor [Hyphomicrobiales bacterium]
MGVSCVQPLTSRAERRVLVISSDQDCLFSLEGRRVTLCCRRLCFVGSKALTDKTHPKITPREKEIMGLIAEGLSSREISKRLGIAYFTVRKHRSNILPKLGLHDAAALQAFAAAHFFDAEQKRAELGPKLRPILMR